MTQPGLILPRPGKANNVVLFILAGVGLMAVLGCLTCGGVAWFGWSAAMNVIADEIKTKYGDAPAMQDNIGEITSFKSNFEKTAKEQEETGTSGIMVFDIEGPKGKGEIIAERRPGQPGFSKVKLRTETGEEFQLE